jgi:chromosome segregation ATPase
MRLELKRLRDALSQRADKVFTLENRKQQLKLSMQERKKEIAVHTEVQAAQLRLAEEERHKAQIEVGQRKQQVAKLAAKYETLCKSSRLRGTDEDDGEPKSQAYYLIQAAQKREELQRQGDELDQEIRRREREMRALEATLAHVNKRNSSYRQSFQKANMKSNEAEDMKQLEEQAKLAQDALFRRKKELQRLSTDFEEDERRLQQVEAQCGRLEERNGHLAEAHARLSMMHREKIQAFDETVQEKSFRAKSLAEANMSILRTLGELAKAYPELKDVLANMLQEAGIQPDVN